LLLRLLLLSPTSQFWLEAAADLDRTDKEIAKPTGQKPLVPWAFCFCGWFALQQRVYPLPMKVNERS